MFPTSRLQERESSLTINLWPWKSHSNVKLPISVTFTPKTVTNKRPLLELYHGKCQNYSKFIDPWPPTMVFTVVHQTLKPIQVTHGNAKIMTGSLTLDLWWWWPHSNVTLPMGNLPATHCNQSTVLVEVIHQKWQNYAKFIDLDLWPTYLTRQKSLRWTWFINEISIKIHHHWTLLPEVREVTKTQIFMHWEMYVFYLTTLAQNLNQD